jgi:hypothetical protein
METYEKETRPTLFYTLGGILLFVLGIYSLTSTRIGWFIPFLLLMAACVFCLCAMACWLAEDTPIEQQVNDSSGFMMNRTLLRHCIFDMIELGLHAPEDENYIPKLQYQALFGLLLRRGYSRIYIMNALKTLQEQKRVQVKDGIVYFTFYQDVYNMFLMTVK